MEKDFEEVEIQEDPQEADRELYTVAFTRPAAAEYTG